MRYGEMAAGRRGGEIEKLLRQCDNGSVVICWEIGHLGQWGRTARRPKHGLEPTGFPSALTQARIRFVIWTPCME